MLQVYDEFSWERFRPELPRCEVTLDLHVSTRRLDETECSEVLSFLSWCRTTYPLLHLSIHGLIEAHLDVSLDRLDQLALLPALPDMKNLCKNTTLHVHCICTLQGYM